jgi:hypothetical protein
MQYFKTLQEEIAELRRKVDEIKIPQPQVVIISIDYIQFWTSLVWNGILEPFSQVYYMYVPPNTTISWTVNMPPNKVSIVTEENIVVSPDHALSTQIYMDGKLIFKDDDMVQARYATPLNFFNLGAIYPAKRYMQFTVQNKSSTDTAYWSVWSKGGIIEYTYYDKFFTKFFDIISKALLE